MFKHSVANKYTVVAKNKGEIITPATIDTRNVKDVAALIRETGITKEDLDIEIEVDLHGYYSPPEKATHDYPGYPEEINDLTVTYKKDGKDVDITDHLNDQFLKDAKHDVMDAVD